MDQDRRDDIRHIACQLEALRSELEDILTAEEEDRDGIPEDLRGSRQYEIVDTACDTLDEAVDGLEDIVASLDELTRS